MESEAKKETARAAQLLCGTRRDPVVQRGRPVRWMEKVSARVLGLGGKLYRTRCQCPQTSTQTRAEAQEGVVESPSAIPSRYGRSLHPHTIHDAE